MTDLGQRCPLRVRKLEPAIDLGFENPVFSDEVNRNIAQSEIEGGVCLDNLSDGETLEVETQNRCYTIVVGKRGQDLIWGHPLSSGTTTESKGRQSPFVEGRLTP